MTVAPSQRQLPTSPASAGAPSGLAGWAVGLSAAFVVGLAAALATYGLAYAVGGEGAVEDSWIAVHIATTAFLAVLAAASGFVLAIAAVIRRERLSLLAAPLAAFPAFVAFVVLGEALWWE